MPAFIMILELWTFRYELILGWIMSGGAGHYLVLDRLSAGTYVSVFDAERKPRVY